MDSREPVSTSLADRTPDRPSVLVTLTRITVFEEGTA